MINYNNILKKKAFDFDKIIKKKFFLINQKKLVKHHYNNSKEYKKILNIGFSNFNKINKIEDLPYLHSKLFKDYNLKSIKDKNIITLKSSGTSGNNLSKININLKNSLIQAQVLKKILFDFIPKDIDTIIIIDQKKNFENYKNFNARIAAQRGFAQYFKKKYFILNKENKINLNLLNKFKNLINKKKVLFFGFTDTLWFNFIEVLSKKKIYLKQNNNYVIHGGGWKKLEAKKISKEKLNDKIKKILGTKEIYNYYGMIEQVGSIFMECKYGFFHSSIFSDILIRDKNLIIEKNFTPGIIQVLSLLPFSYPGHSILTEDLGYIAGEDTCKCKRKGKYFKVLNRIPNSENRGCANV